MMQQMAKMGLRERLQAVRGLADAGMMDPNAQLAHDKQRSKRGPLDQNKARDKKKQQRKDARKARKRNRELETRPDSPRDEVRPRFSCFL